MAYLKKFLRAVFDKSAHSGNFPKNFTMNHWFSIKIYSDFAYFWLTVAKNKPKNEFLINFDFHYARFS
jgi:hypothetical protein